MTTVHAEVGTSHEAAAGAEEEDSCAPVLLWGGQTAKHVLLRPVLAALGVLDEQLFNHRGDDVAR